MVNIPVAADRIDGAKTPARTLPKADRRRILTDGFMDQEADASVERGVLANRRRESST
jgi:hypothetical protein